jgi:hypothetical protein
MAALGATSPLMLVATKELNPRDFAGRQQRLND